ncbi:MAG: glycosyltransferase family 2 protein [Polyangiaceae bacterium]
MTTLDTREAHDPGLGSVALPTFTVVVPTVGRSTLARTLASIASQLLPGDELIVVCNDDGDFGNTASLKGAGRAFSSHILFCDDDDIFLPGALSRMRAWAGEHPTAIGVFRRRFSTGELQWQSPVIARGSVQRMLLCLPNRGLGGWSGLDQDFLVETARTQDAEILWVDDVVGLARPERNPLRRLRYRLRLGTRLRAFVRGSLRTSS